MESYDAAFFQGLRAGARNSALRIVPLILELVPCKNVIDVGCGAGTWLQVFREHGVADVVGLDGDYVDRALLEISQNEFLPLDLTQPFLLGRTFDLVVSLEVAEHLPPQCADAFVESLTSLGPVVLFSAAIPHQLGVNHVNEQWPEYWAALFRERKYEAIDCIRSKVWHDDEVEHWYAQNVLIYARRDYLEGNAALRRAFVQTDPAALSIVHPRTYLFTVGHFRAQAAHRRSPAVALIAKLARRLRMHFDARRAAAHTVLKTSVNP